MRPCVTFFFHISSEIVLMYCVEGDVVILSDKKSAWVCFCHTISSPIAKGVEPSSTVCMIILMVLGSLYWAATENALGCQSGTRLNSIFLLKPETNNYVFSALFENKEKLSTYPT